MWLYRCRSLLNSSIAGRARRGLRSLAFSPESLEVRELLTALSSRTSDEAFAASVTPAALPDAGGLTVPAYSSLPGAAAVIYLNFLGHHLDRWLTYTDVTTPVFDTDSDSSSFSADELNTIRLTWEYVAEDYAPFNINVTTVPPLSDPEHIPAHVSQINIGAEGSWYHGTTAGGVGQLGGFAISTASNPVYGFAFVDQFTDGESLGGTISHESGHNLGLVHQSEWDGTTKVREYYQGPNYATSPLMGGGGYRFHDQWWYGTATDDSSHIQDDFALIAGIDRVGLRPDDIGDSAAAAQAMTVEGDTSRAAGLIGTEADVDYWSFTAGPGKFQIKVTTNGHVGNMTPVLEFRDASGQFIGSDIGRGQNGFDRGTAAVSYETDVATTFYAIVRSAGREADSTYEVHTTADNHGYEVGTYKVTVAPDTYEPTELTIPSPSITTRAGAVQFIAPGTTLEGTDAEFLLWDQILVTYSDGKAAKDVLSVAPGVIGSHSLKLKAKRLLILDQVTIASVTALSSGLRIDFEPAVDRDQALLILRRLTFKSQKKSPGARHLSVSLRYSGDSQEVGAALTVNVT